MSNVPDATGLVGRAREACQDRGAGKFIRDKHDAYVLGEAGLEAVRTVLEHLRDDGGAWLTFDGAVYVDCLLDEIARA